MPAPRRSSAPYIRDPRLAPTGADPRNRASTGTRHGRRDPGADRRNVVAVLVRPRWLSGGRSRAMVEQVEWVCPTCRGAVTTPYCAHCGEEPLPPRDLTLRGIAEKALHALTSIDA